MTIRIEDESSNAAPNDSSAFDFDIEKLADEVINEALDQEECPYECEIDLTLTTNEGIHEINKEYRDIDRPTDVLSFPLVDYEEPGNFDTAEEHEYEYFNPESGELMLGDIIISTEKVLEQAENYGHSVKREFAFLIAHSMFHLMGYDHMVPEEAKVMEEKQEAVLQALGISR